ncbi:SDR family oxidoreductase [Nitrospirillum bahiense]|uniref:NADP-dependent 3-hydroxy acid dehydrogenase YdfG n=1 Tax=Nitrospirillum amazonense TaxID=28077 RepID=A0A560GDH5_9PROT|nr:SDR family oxidoreductase [Nitrospirillum amazonense]TWB31965.1 NADP-dependent 3-hydroxy acid dehydrogenase YdfG [Nitrospirillum amazonense]
MTSPLPTDSRVALITGANKGIGLEIARGLGRQGVTVLLGCRNEALGRDAAGQLTQEGLHAHALTLDVTDLGSALDAAARIQQRFGRLDILVNNAGIAAREEADAAREGKPLVDVEVMRRIYETNVFGAVAVTQAMLPLLRQAPAGRIVNVSSGLGSLTNMSDPRHPYAGLAVPAYASSKAALNGVTAQLAKALKDTPIKVNSACPGHCATDLNRHSGPRTPAQGAATPIRLALLPVDGPTGGFFNDEGALPW